MPRFAANLSTLFNEMPFEGRFAAAAKAGFKGVEFLFPYAYPASELAAALDKERPDPGALQFGAGGLGGGRTGLGRTSRARG